MLYINHILSKEVHIPFSMHADFINYLHFLQERTAIKFSRVKNELFVLDVVCLYALTYDTLSEDWSIICLVPQLVRSFGRATYTCT